MCHPTVIRLLVLVRGCSVIPELGWIPGDWGGIIPSQACGGLDPSQSTSNLLLTGINKPLFGRLGFTSTSRVQVHIIVIALLIV
jgi:hypothetical protein